MNVKHYSTVQEKRSLTRLHSRAPTLKLSDHLTKMQRESFPTTQSCVSLGAAQSANHQHCGSPRTCSGTCQKPSLARLHNRGPTLKLSDHLTKMQRESFPTTQSCVSLGAAQSANHQHCGSPRTCSGTCHKPTLARQQNRAPIRNFSRGSISKPLTPQLISNVTRS